MGSSNNDKLSLVSAESIPQAKLCANNQEPQNSYDILQGQTSTLAPSIPCQPSETVQNMELGGGEGGGGGGGSGGGDGQEVEEMNSSFNLTGTSLDFSNQCSDLESGQLQMFSIQPEITRYVISCDNDRSSSFQSLQFNLLQSESFFTTHQPSQTAGTMPLLSNLARKNPCSIDGTYGFMSEETYALPEEITKTSSVNSTQLASPQKQVSTVH